ncbi:MAG: hypothetical protein R2747_04160 [Pyrinomonadaceae bacterium]
MKCWHCNSDLEINIQTDDFTLKFYHCDFCDKWYEMRKEKVKINGAMPVRFFELDARPNLHPNVIAAAA